MEKNNKIRNLIIGLCAALAGFGLFVFILAKNNPSTMTIVNNIARQVGLGSKSDSINDPEISGWVAWWDEQAGYEAIERNKQSLNTVSPGWFNLDKDGKLAEIGQVDKAEVTTKIHDASLMLYPMVVTDLTGQDLADFINDKKSLDAFIAELVNQLKKYNADGLDLDFENIDAKYEKEFSTLVKTLADQLHDNNLKFALTIQAQTENSSWQGTKGQNFEQLSQHADQVRIMAYDKHGKFSESGPITPMDWYRDVVSYAAKRIPREKIVIGLPAYGYIWFKDGSFGSYFYQNFVDYAKDLEYTVERDPDSYELKYTNSTSTGWLSDSEAAIQKINYARLQGINRFVIWNFAGMDEELFAGNWDELDVATDSREE